MSSTGARSTSIAEPPQVRGGRRALAHAPSTALPSRPDRGAESVGRPVGKPLDGAAFLVDRDQQRRVAARRGRRLELRDEPRRAAPCVPMLRAEEDDAADLAGPDPREQRRARRGAVDPGHDRLPDEPRRRRRRSQCGAGRAGHRDGDGERCDGGERSDGGAKRRHARRRPTSTRSISTLSSRTTMSAGRPTSSRPSLRQPEHARRHGGRGVDAPRRAARRARAGSAPPRSSSARYRRARRRGRAPCRRAPGRRGCRSE